jgi:SAM domain (Sterile alpha motif)
MLDVARWLAERGLGHWAEAFAANGIAGDVLCDLTDADLRELGLNLGDRKCLLKAIAASPPTTGPGLLSRRRGARFRAKPSGAS